MLEQLGAQHRRQGQRNRRRDQDGRTQGNGEFTEQPASNVAHEQEWNQNRDQRNSQRHDRETDLLRALESRRERRLASFDIARDVFDHHDCIVDHKTGGDGERHQGQIVQTEAERIHRAECPDQRQRHRDAGNDRRRKRAQKNENNGHHERDAQHQLEFHVGHRGPHRRGAIRQHSHFDHGRNGGAQLGKQRLDAIHHVDDVRAGLPLDVHDDRGHLVHPG